MRDPGIAPGSVPWQGIILPLNQPRIRAQCAISTLYEPCIIFILEAMFSLSSLSSCMCILQAAMVVPRTIRSMVHAKISLQGGSRPNSCIRKVAALRVLIKRSSVCDQVRRPNDAAQKVRGCFEPMFTNLCRQPPIQSSFAPTSVLKSSVCRCNCDQFTPGQRAQGHLHH